MFKLEQFGLGRKSKAPFAGKHQKDARDNGLKRNIYLKAAIILTFLTLLIVFFPGSSFRDFNFKVGEPWRDDDLTAPFTFSLLKDREELRSEQIQARANTPSVFYIEPEKTELVDEQIDIVFEELSPVLDAFEAWFTSQRTGSDGIERDSLAFQRVYNSYSGALSSSSLQALMENYALTVSPSNRQAANRFIGIDIRLQLSRIIRELHTDGVLDIPKPELGIPEITVRNARERTQQIQNSVTMRDIPEAKDFARFRLNRVFSGDTAQAAMEIFEVVMQPNYIFSMEDTEEAIQEAIESISPTKGAVTAGQMIIRKGDLITPERLNMLQSLEAARASRASDFDRWQQTLGNSLIVMGIFLFFMMYLYLYRNPIYDNNAMLTLVLLAMGIVLAFAIFIIRLDGISIYIVPLAIAPIILTIIFDSRVGLMTTSALALTIAFMSGNNFEYVVAAVTASSIAVYSVRDIKNRSQFFLTTPALVFISYIIISVGFTLNKPSGWEGFGSQALHIAGSSIFIWLTYPLILLFEKLFKVTTEVSLLELNNNNHPLLKQLMSRAPGTFQHSLQVANLAEAAASAINANSLLCRVGAMYHDIGKMDKPEYFVENQFGPNEHDKLKPRMSAMVIKNHVTTGVKMGEEANLPDVIIDFIRTHHGDSIIKYFYDKAQKTTEKGSEVREEDFRYDGPIPNSKETGILLLADGIEASSRAMSEPSYQKLENLVNRMVDERLEEGQLNNCDLTYRDLSKIKEAFLGILVGMYHSRVKYPGQDQKDNAIPGAIISENTPKGEIEVHAPKNASDISEEDRKNPSGSD
ncbi:MAG: HDIG domain-containing protein [Bacteroidetes bacterium]|nr:HDIG domain-containing protein [Bacteroidota bacterium]